MKSSNNVLNFRTEVLSPRALALISEFALVLYRSNGTIIEVGARDAISQVFDNAARVTVPRLNEICTALRAELISKFSPKTVYRDQQSVIPSKGFH